MRAFLTSIGDGKLIPACETSEKLARRVGAGELVEVDWKSRNTRSVQWNKRYWLLLTTIFDNIERIQVGQEWVVPKTKKHLHMLLKLKAGLYDFTLKTKSGEIAYVVGSISFDEMPHEDWVPYWNKVLDLVHQEILPNTELPFEIENAIAELAT